MYVSVFGDERGKKVAMAGLKDKTKYVRSQIGKRMKLRLTPEIRFIEDESMERGSRVCLIIFVFVLTDIDVLRNAMFVPLLPKTNSSSCTISMSFHPFFIFH